jgi:hypothetical protein
MGFGPVRDFYVSGNRFAVCPKNTCQRQEFYIYLRKKQVEIKDFFTNRWYDITVKCKINEKRYL